MSANPRDVIPYCCYIEKDGRTGCENAAGWEIENPWVPPSEGITQACTEHVGNLLDDAPIQYITPIELPI